MRATIYGSLKASTVAIALLGSAALVTTVVAPDVAIAKEGKGNGGGKGGDKGNSGGKGNGGGKGNSGDHSSANKKGSNKSSEKSRGGWKAGKSKVNKSKSNSARSTSGNGGRFSLKDLFNGKKKKTKTYKQPSKTVIVEESIRPAVRTKGNKIASLLGAHPSELGALNAANASETALANASPYSRVGRIATYRDTVLAGEPLREELAEQLEELSGLEQPERLISEIEEDLEAALGDVQDNQERVEELEQALEDAGGTDPVIEEQLDEARTDLDNSVDEAQELNEERQAALDYEEATEEARDLAELVEEQDLAEREALEAAANKPVTDAVEEEVKSLLGL
ncbi:hypothetical protein [uncultured Ruegeria sp.]|uniref:hypothetical protein n=1 Tax=uncultured Ruegeria sp. TaxID=259304 RepID=UPI00261E5E14|nr:hypothetical protein [uncultured Ruegeria sp.]